jgi:hypothetical protein
MMILYTTALKGTSLPLLHLETHTAIKNLDAEKYQIVFECIDGYKPMMPLQNSFRSNHFLPSGTDAPKGNYGQIIKDGNEMKAAPFYLVYQGVSAKETDLEWPYNLIKYTLSLMMKTSHSCFQRKFKADLAMNYSKKMRHLSYH